MIKIRRGLYLPITGDPEQVISEAPHARSVAVIGPDYHGMKPTMAVQVGDKVKLGQVLFTDKKTEGVSYTAPASGTVAAINRGARRVLQSVVIDVEGDEAESFAKYSADEIPNLSSEKIIENLEDGTISFCDHSTFTDLCRGGHIPNTSIIKATILRRFSKVNCPS